MVKLTDRCFCCFTAAMLVPLRRAPTWRFHTKLYKFGWSTFPNNARMKNRTELNLGKVFYIWLIYHIQDFWLNLLNGYDIYFWLRDTANQPLALRASVRRLGSRVSAESHPHRSTRTRELQCSFITISLYLRQEASFAPLWEHFFDSHEA